MKFLSVCSGIEAASVAWNPLGFECIGVSEIEQFPSAVLKYHYPEVKNFGDLTKYEEWNIPDFDVLIGGTPCQSFSVAGKRGGLDDPRGRVMLSYLGLAKKHKPRWVVWENVPGVLSSGGGRDFGTFIWELEKLGYSLSWRVLDAQYFGVPQRRRRVFLVGYLGSWQYPAAVLFERGCMQRDIDPMRKERQDIAPTVGTGAPYSRTGNSRTEIEAVVMSSCRQNAEIYEGIVPAILASHEHPIVFEPGIMSRLGGYCAETEISSTIQAQMGGNQTSVMFNDRPRRIMPVECERLQGFPDGHTNIPWRGKSESPDSLRYKALGNSMAVPVIRWIGERINVVNSFQPKKEYQQAMSNITPLSTFFDESDGEV